MVLFLLGESAATLVPKTHSLSVVYQGVAWALTHPLSVVYQWGFKGGVLPKDQKITN